MAEANVEMFPPKLVQLPVDFSPRSALAAHYAATIARRFRLEVHLVHALATPHYAAGMEIMGDLYADRMEEGKQLLEAFGEKELQGLGRQLVLCSGDPAQGILDLTRREPNQLVVMPTNGYGKVLRLLLGSTTTKVLHDSLSPILTIAHDRPYYEGSEPSFDHVLCAVDLSDGSAKALDWASHFARGFGARLSLLHVIPELEPADEEYYVADRNEGLAGEAYRKIAILQSQASTNALPIVAGGKMPAAVHRQIEELRADLLVIARGAAAKGFLGPLETHTYDLIRDAPCPVVSV